MVKYQDQGLVVWTELVRSFICSTLSFENTKQHKKKLKINSDLKVKKFNRINMKINKLCIKLTSVNLVSKTINISQIEDFRF